MTFVPSMDDSSSADECQKTNVSLPRMTSERHKAKVVRKSRKCRQQKAVSFSRKQTSVGIQTDSIDALIAGAQQPQSTCDNKLVSTGTQTDDVIVINVSEQLHASSYVADGLFKSCHSGLLPAIRVSDVNSAGCDRDTDSGHMSDTENKLLSAAAESESVDCEELYCGPVMYKPLSTVCRVNEEVNGVVVEKHMSPPAESMRHGNWQQSKDANIQNINSSLLSSTERCQLTRWTTATRLDILEQSDRDKVGRQTATFFASLETSGSEQAASNEVDISGITVLSNHKECNLLSSCSGMLSRNSQTRRFVDRIHMDVISSDNSQSQSPAGTRCHDMDVLSQPCGNARLSNSSGGSVPRPSVGTGCKIANGSPQSRGKPRLSVGRKSLSKRRSTTVRDKCHPPTKISRPAAWLMSATKASRSKVQDC